MGNVLSRMAIAGTVVLAAGSGQTVVEPCFHDALCDFGWTCDGQICQPIGNIRSLLSDTTIDQATEAKGTAAANEDYMRGINNLADYVALIPAEYSNDLPDAIAWSSGYSEATKKLATAKNLGKDGHKMPPAYEQVPAQKEAWEEGHKLAKAKNLGKDGHKMPPAYEQVPAQKEAWGEGHVEYERAINRIGQPSSSPGQRKTSSRAPQEN